VTAAAIVLAGVGCLAALAGWLLPRPLLPAAAAVTTLGGAALVAVLDTEPASREASAVLVVVAGLLAVLGGGPVATAVFTLVDREQPDRAGSLRGAGEVLRGGAWIGVLERAGVYVTVVVGWPAGLAVLLALKGLGRYPELRVQEDSGAAERFIIGTLASSLWAVACAGLALTA
jgi:hypothetical protein